MKQLIKKAGVWTLAVLTVVTMFGGSAMAAWSSGGTVGTSSGLASSFTTPTTATTTTTTSSADAALLGRFGSTTTATTATTTTAATGGVLTAYNTTTATTPNASTVAGTGTATVINVKNDVTFRQGPGTNYGKVSGCSKVPVNATVTVTAKSGEWYKCTYGSYSGYIKAEFLTTPEINGNTATANTNTTGTTSSFTPGATTFGSNGTTTSTLSGKYSVGGGVGTKFSSGTTTYNSGIAGTTGTGFAANSSKYNTATTATTAGTTGTTGTTSTTATNTVATTPTGSGETPIPAAAKLTAEQTTFWKATIAKYTAQKASNPDTVGWIYVPGTSINYPIMYSASYYYADHLPDKSKNSRGSIFSFASGLTNITTISGHNMRGSAKKSNDRSIWMFHELHHIRCALEGRTTCDYCKKSCAGQATTIFNITMGDRTAWQLFAMYEAKGIKYQNENCMNFNLSGTQLQSWINTQLQRSTKNFGVTVSPSDKIMVIQTCGKSTGNNETHFYMFLKAIA